MLLSPCYFNEPLFYFGKVNSNRDAHMFSYSGIPAFWLLWTRALWGHIIFLQSSSSTVVHNSTCMWEFQVHVKKNRFSERLLKNWQGLAWWKHTGKNTEMHNRSPTLPFCINSRQYALLFTFWLITIWSKKQAQPELQNHQLRCSGRLLSLVAEIKARAEIFGTK